MKTTDKIVFILAITITISILAILGLLVFVEIPSKNEQPLNIILGTLVAAFGAIIQYFFGSSLGSKDKQEIINNSNNNLKKS